MKTSLFALALSFSLAAPLVLPAQSEPLVEVDPLAVQSQPPAETGLLEQENETPVAEQSALSVEAALDIQSEIDRLNTFVRSIRSIRGGFVQTAPNGSLETGDFYWKRPGQLRIEYNESPLLIVADGSNIAQIDKDLETIDQVRISWTPYKFLLAKNFDLTKGMELVGIQKLATETRVTVTDPDGEIDGEFTLVFSEPTLALLGWTWTTAFDGQVDFRLQDTVEGTRLASSLFVIREAERRRGGRR
ncbi:MAG: outer membrane lipoprotein carrier protein LolA [Robiginitomaculum sp.]|nr:outer membrane lipoprotein carrier protein LolA [Robiginitomaculum sp.]